MKWVPFGFGVFMAISWWLCVCRPTHLSIRTTIATTLLIGLAMEAWFRIVPLGLRDK